MIDLDALKNRLKGLRGRLALSQAEAAAEMGVPYRTFQSWENGEVETSEANYERVAGFYKRKLADETITKTWILYGDEGPAVRVGRERADLRALEARLRREMDLKFTRLKAELLAELGLTAPAPGVVTPERLDAAAHH